jgi:hypothetical protein
LLITAIYKLAGADQPPSSDELVGINVFILSFLKVSGSTDQLLEFTNLDPDTQTSIIDDYHSNGISFMVAAFSDSDAPTTDGTDPVEWCNSLWLVGTLV